MAANGFFFGAGPVAPATIITKPSIYPVTSDCQQFLEQAPAIEPAADIAQTLSVSKLSGDLYLGIQSRYSISLAVADVIPNHGPAREHVYPTKLFPVQGCCLPDLEKLEILVTLALTLCLTAGFANGPDRIQILQRILTNYSLSLAASKLPPGYRLEFNGFKLQSVDQKAHPAFCRSVEGFGSPTMKAVVDMTPDGRVTLFFDLRLVALSPYKNAFEQGRSLASRLLGGASVTGDVILRTQGGTELPAHSLVLSDIPFFKARFGPNWRKEPKEGERSVCMLPVEASEESLAAFLAYVYGEPHSLDTIKSHTVLQALFSLGEACDLPILCKDVAHATKIQESEIQDWIEWLGREHVSAVEPIRERVTGLVKQAVLAKKDSFWEHLSTDELSSIFNAAKRHKKDT